MLGGKLIQYQNELKWYTYIISFTNANVNEFLYHLLLNLFTNSDIQKVYHFVSFDTEKVYHLGV